MHQHPQDGESGQLPDSQFHPKTAARHPASLRFVLLSGILLMLAVFLALGTWQIQRLQWKRDLIARVDQRVHAAAIEAPGTAVWQHINAQEHEYLHVRLNGQFLFQDTVKVQALTVLGSGYWLLTPLRTADGQVVLINRGFIPPHMPDAQALSASSHPVAVQGLLRLTEPVGGFLRHNDPLADLWYSRDVQAIAKSHKLTDVAPYFIDADAGRSDNASTYPVGGLTVISFPNNHLVYALTWYAMALMMVIACFWIWRRKPD